MSIEGFPYFTSPTARRIVVSFILTGPFSHRYSSERHSVASHWLYRQLHSPFVCEYKGLGKARLISSRKIDHRNSGFQSLGLGFRSWNQSFKAYRFGLRTISFSDVWPVYNTEKSSLIPSTRKSRLGKTLSMAGIKSSANTAMEVCYGTDSSKPDQVDAPVNLKNAANGAASLSGSVCTAVGKSTNIAWQECIVKKEEREKLLGQKGCVIWITGLSGSGKSTLACTLDHALLKRGNLSYIIDGDNVRHGLNNNLGFCAEDRTENIRRIGEVAKLFANAGLVCIASAISPYRKDRDVCRQLFHAGEFIEVHMNFPLSLCEERDPKGLYKLARAGKIKGFTGVDDPYEAPVNCEVVFQPVDGRCPTPGEMASQLISFLEERQILRPPR